MPSGSTYVNPTNSASHALTVKHYNAALFHQTLGKAAMGDLGMMEGAPPNEDTLKGLVTGKISYEETARTMPGVRLTDLQKSRGDTVFVDIVHPASGRPTMGDKNITGRRSTTTFSSMPVKLDQMRLGHDAGGEMSQQRTKHDLRKIGRNQVLDMAARTVDQVRLIQCAGARGDIDGTQWMVPLATDSEFGEIVVNPVKAPSYNRHFYAHDATSIDTLDADAFITLNDIARLRQAIDEMDSPMLPVTLPGDEKASARNPLYILRVTPRQWHHLQTYHDGYGKDWQTFQANARNRGSSNPLFTGDEVGVWRGILVIKGLLPIGWNQGSDVTVTTSAAAYTETTVTVPTFDGSDPASAHRVERALLFGGQAWASLYGKDSKSGMPTRWYEGMEDDDNRFVCSLSGMCGFSKLSFLDKDGVYTDHGIAALDSYAPLPTSSPLTVNVD